MIGGQVVVTNVNAQELVPWREHDINRLVDSAFAPASQSSHEARVAFQTMFEAQLREVMILTARFLGDAPDTSGGTMGAPRRPPDWMYLLMGALSDSFMNATLVVYDPPHSMREKSKRAIRRYMWHMVQFHD